MGIKVHRLSAIHILGLLFALVVSLGGPNAVLAQEGISQPTVEDSSVAALPEYRVNPGDQLEISVWREDQLQRIVRVLPDGTLSFPLVGTIMGAGRTTRQIEADLSAGLAGKYVDGNVPDVTVAVAETSGLQFSVIGKVNSPGTFTPGRYLTLLEALSLAGGVTEFASLSNVTVIRKSGDGLVVIPVKLSAILRSRSISSEAVNALPLIQSGDTVIVP
ncbi:MAG: polysaccharide biosynthesis/export family protein [Pseudomonadota bacterium]